MDTQLIEPEPWGISGQRRLALAGIMPPAPRLAIVGSRALMKRNAQCIGALVELAAARGLSVVSGGARGADVTAHRAALAAELPQLVVLPCGPDRVYPPEHAGLFDEIRAAPYSGVLFGAEAGVQFSRRLFASRNRVVVALSAAVIVVQAALRSGSLGTGRLALRRGVPCAALLSSDGGQALVGEGARSLGFGVEAQWPQRVASFLDAVVGAGQPESSQPRWPPALVWLRQGLAKDMGKGVSLDSFGDPLGALCALTEACTLGLVVEATPGRYRAVDS